jgi:hypothetical protein
MKLLVSVGLIFSVAVSSCKGLEQSSRSKSLVGLNAELDQNIVRGEAPSFLYLQQWFKHELPVDVAKAQAGGVAYRVHGDFTQSTFDSLPAEYRERLIAYLKQQQSRIAEFQANLDRPGKLNQLLKLESAEMADILMALIEPSYQPKTKDLLAHLIAHKPLRSFIDRYSVELLEKLYARSQRSLVIGMEKERDNFAKILSRSFVTEKGATEKFRNSLESNCAKVAAVLQAMTGSSRSDCKAAAQTNLTGSPSIESAVGALDDSNGKAFGVFGALASPGGFAASGVSPRLRIFANRDPNANDPYAVNPTNPAADGGAVAPIQNNTNPNHKLPDDGNNNNGNNNNNGGGGTNLLSLLIGLFSGMSGNSDMLLTETDEVTQAFDLAPPVKPRGVCSGLSGLDLVVCQRYIETLPAAISHGGANDDQSGSFSLNNDGVSTNNSGYNFFLISKYATKVQNQGSEGACTAFGLAHTLGILARIKGKNGEYNAWNIWNSQGQQPSTNAAIGAAKRMNFDGLRITKSRSYNPSVAGYKRLLDAGRPIYFASDVDGSWNGASRGNASLSCRGSTGAHAYTIVGYDDSNQKFVIKNSWGDYWGDKGYGYLPYSCIGRMNDYGYDIEIN